IPGNDDAIRSIKFITSCIANAVIEGRNIKEGIGMSQESGVRSQEEEEISQFELPKEALEPSEENYDESEAD
ncbi:MAG: 30S ribosomal protein S2, partial [bacterium]